MRRGRAGRGRNIHRGPGGPAASAARRDGAAARRPTGRGHASLCIGSPSLLPSIFGARAPITTPMTVPPPTVASSAAPEARLFALSPDVMVVMGLDGTLLRANPATLAILMRDERDVIGRSVLD